MYSEKGLGTTFRIYLPLLDQPLQREQPELSYKTIPKGDETILLVDDDADVRKITELHLNDLGYRVLVADNGKAALSTFKDNREAIQLLITDVIMPKMNGIELYEEIHKLNVYIPAIFMSGYAAEIIEEKTLPIGNVTFLSKPIKTEILLSSVRKMLDSGKSN